jgi:tripartite-type tricarboxylate transporter receptor subunit TctC
VNKLVSTTAASVTRGIARAMILLTLTAGHAAAQEYPSKPIRMIVPFAAGGSSDIGARMFAQRMQQRMGQSVIVENKVGAEGVIGTDFVVKSAPDGYTILAVGGSSYTPALIKNLPFDLIRDLAPVSMVRYGPTALIAHAGFAPKNIRELQAWIKANPGKLNFGASTASTTLATELLKHAGGLEGTLVPYKGSGQVVTALVAGEVQVALDSPIPYKGHIESGRVRILALTDKERLPLFPNAMTTHEQGVNFSFSTNSGFWVPARTPRPVIERLNKEIVAIVHDPEVKKWVETSGSISVGSTPEYFRDFVARDHQLLTDGAKLINYRPD